MGEAMKVVEELGRGGLFRVRDVKRRGLSANWLPFFRDLFGYVHHGHGVWSHKRYQPTRYEVLQVRFPQAAFWGPSALWLLGELDQEPAALWIAIDNKGRPPQTLDPTTVIIRTRRLNDDLRLLRGAGQLTTLRVYNSTRAHADVLRRTFARTTSPRPTLSPPPARRSSL